ncbi:MAG TPA: hypothetical protein VJ890_22335 [Vineibacter sp.]|nr:hypothetical protein [Vineibacter sp.]
MLKGSVGQKGDNLPQDVATVEFLLNRSMRRAYPERRVGDITLLRVDDKVTAGTIDAIKAFQKKWLGFNWPDGRVDPKGPTFRALCKLFHKDGGVVLLTPQQVAIQADPVSVYQHNGPAYLPSVFKGGDFIPGLDGTRLVLSINAKDTIFILRDNQGPGDDFLDQNPMRGKVGHVYGQATPGFLDECGIIFFQNLSSKLQLAKSLIQAEAELILGLIAGSSSIGFVAVVGATIGPVLWKHRKDFDNWARILLALGVARGRIKQYAPTLWDKLFESTIYVLMSRLPPNVKLKTVSYSVGVLLGGIASKVRSPAVIEGAVAHGYKVFSVPRFALALIIQVILIALKTVPNAVVEATQNWRSVGPEVFKKLEELGVQVSPEDRRKIEIEILTHPRELQDTLTELHRAIEENLPN